jgi:hypothetical protein
MEGPRNASNAPDWREGVSAANGSECLGRRRRTDSVPSDIPAAMWVSSGCRWPQICDPRPEKNLQTEIAKQRIGAGYRIVCAILYMPRS